MGHKLRFRQIHLDYHTSPAIDGIGAGFDKKHWQDTLRRAAVDSITTFATCHHGWSYFDTKTGRRHPHLGFDLLRGQMDASKEIDVNVPLYITAGVHNMMARENPQWREITADGQYGGWAKRALDAGFHKLCFNTPYLDFLCGHIAEVVEKFPEADGIFLDIISQGQCCCPWCLEGMLANDLNPEVEVDRGAWAKRVLEEYYRRTTEAAKSLDARMPVFHNSGHIRRGERGILKYFSHLELESLPTGGWGYDHFPMSAKYCAGLGLDMLGMTGKFHTTWGEFGGYKHPNALRYECAAMIAYGAKCSVGDQLHPDAKLDESTYEIIGAAYREVAAKEEWCDNATSVADVGILSGEAVNPPGGSRDNAADVGACRVLLEGHFLFDVIDAEMDFSKYKMLVLPDDIQVGGELKAKLDAYLAAGGKLFITGASALDPGTGQSMFDIGAEFAGASPFRPDYVCPAAGLAPAFAKSPMVMYLNSQRIKVTDGESLGDVFDPYFNRDFRHFCSHQHAPPRPESSGYACGVRKGAIMYLAHPVFSIYRAIGAVACRDYIAAALRLLLGESNSIATNLPSTARVSLMDQAEHRRQVLHLLYAPTINRGGGVKMENNPLGNIGAVEVIEELPSLRGVRVALKLPAAPARLVLQPQGKTLEFTTGDNGAVEFVLDELACHQMVVAEMA